MGVSRVNGQDFAALFAPKSVQPPAPQVHANEAASAKEAKGASTQKKDKEQVGVAATSTKAQQSVPKMGERRFRIDRDSKGLVAQILDENNQVVKQIPPEEILKFAKSIRKLEGLLFDKRA